VTGYVTVPNGVTLTIQPGAVVKFSALQGMVIDSGGQLVAHGTVARPVVFTSILDDAVGGDTNLDGNATAPAAGDWHWIYINGGQASFDHAQILYGGGTGGSWNNTGVIRTFGSASLTVSNCVVRDAFYDGVLAWGGTATITNSVFSGIDRAICSHPGSTVNVVNCTLDDNRVGLLMHGGNALNVINTIVTNSIEHGVLRDWSDDNTSIQYSNVWNSGVADYDGTPDRTGTDGNISIDPEYKNARAGNYRLGYTSSCIDAADGISGQHLARADRR